MIWVDGERSASLPLPDRGLSFGDGLFETLLIVNGRSPWLDYHRQRLEAGLAALHFPALGSTFDEAVALALSSLAPQAVAALRITVTRGSGPRGYQAPSPTVPRLVAQLSSLSLDPFTCPAPAKLAVSSLRLASQPLLAGIKHLNRLEQVLATREFRAQNVDEAVMCNQQGQVVSVVAGNLFAVVKGELYTPSLQDCGVSGTRRRALIERWAPRLGLTVHQQALSLEQCLDADELLFCNSLQGLRAVAQLGAKCWGEHPLSQALQQQYLADLQQSVGL